MFWSSLVGAHAARISPVFPTPPGHEVHGILPPTAWMIVHVHRKKQGETVKPPGSLSRVASVIAGSPCAAVAKTLLTDYNGGVLLSSCHMIEILSVYCGNTYQPTSRTNLLMVLI